MPKLCYFSFLKHSRRGRESSLFSTVAERSRAPKNQKAEAQLSYLTAVHDLIDVHRTTEMVYLSHCIYCVGTVALK